MALEPTIHKQSPTMYWDPNGEGPLSTGKSTTVRVHEATNRYEQWSSDDWGPIGIPQSEGGALPEPKRASSARDQGSVKANMCDARIVTTLENATGVRYTGPRGQNVGRTEVISALKEIAAAWFAAHGTELNIGAISEVGGGPLAKRRKGENGEKLYHISHQIGVDVDISIINSGGESIWAKYNDPKSDYSSSNTQDLVNIIWRNRTLAVSKVLFNDPSVEFVRRSPGHDDHLHVRFELPPSEGPDQ